MTPDTALRVTGVLKRQGFAWSDHIGRVGGWERVLEDSGAVVELFATTPADRAPCGRWARSDRYVAALVVGGSVPVICAGRTRLAALAALDLARR